MPREPAAIAAVIAIIGIVAAIKEGVAGEEADMAVAMIEMIVIVVALTVVEMVVGTITHAASRTADAANMVAAAEMRSVMAMTLFMAISFTLDRASRRS